jgi:hypothetical protein
MQESINGKPVNRALKPINGFPTDLDYSQNLYCLYVSRTGLSR